MLAIAEGNDDVDVYHIVITAAIAMLMARTC